MLKINDYEFLCTLYKSKNITQAAQSLFISQPALTKRLQQIEKELDTVIVYRNVKGVQFTPEGEYIVQYSQKCIEDYKELKRGLHRIQTQADTTINIASAGSLAHILLPDLLEHFHKLYPHMHIILHAVGSNETAQRIHNGQADIGFVCGEQPWNFQRDFIRSDYVTLLASHPVPLAELPFLPRIDPKFNTSSQRMISNWWQNNFDIPPRIAMNVPTIQTCVEMIKRDLGYSILMDRTVYKDEPGLYHEILCDNRGKPLERNDYMIYLPEQAGTQPLSTFIRFARDYFSSQRL